MSNTLALLLIERELGQPFHIVETTSTVSVRSSFAQLQNLPLHAIHSVKARKKQWSHSDTFGSQSHTDIPLSDCDILPDGVILPQTIWGSYDEAIIHYSYGYNTVPSAIEQAVLLLEQLVEETGSSSEQTLQQFIRNDDIQQLIQPFHRSNTVRRIKGRG